MAAAPAEQVRPAPRLPVPTTGRLVLLFTAAICLSLLVGQQFCFFAIQPYCHVPVTPVLTMAGAVAVVVAAGAVVLAVTPGVVVWRRRLQVVTGAYAEAAHRAGTLAREAGVDPAPVIMVGPIGQRDAFSFGRPGRYRIALPRALALRARDNPVFDTVVRHELAHLRNRDVAWVWLARSIWRVGYPLLAVATTGMILLAATEFPWDYVDLFRGGWSQLAWQLVLLWLVVAGLMRATVRSREHEADLASARHPDDARQLAAVISTLPSPRHGVWRRIRATHPSPARRLAVLRMPQLGLRTGFVDGLAAAYLGAFSIPMLLDLVIVIWSPHLDIGEMWLVFGGHGSIIATTVPVALMVGYAVGLGLWRTAAAESPALPSRAPVAALAGVALGTGAGLLSSLSSITFSGLHRETTVYLLVVTAFGAGTVAASAVLGRLWAAAFGPTGTWGLPLLANGLLFGSLLCFTFYLGSALTDETGWPVSYVVADLWPGALAAWPLSIVVARLLVVGGRRTWLSWPGLRTVASAGALAGFLGFVAFISTGLNVYSTQEINATVHWGAAVAGVAVWLICCVLSPRTGPAAGFLCGMVAQATFSVVYWLPTLLTDDIPFSFDDVQWMLVIPATLFYALILLLSPLALLLWRRPPRAVSARLMVLTCALSSPIAVALFVTVDRLMRG